MLLFTNFITESLDVEKLKHLEHAEDHIIHGGHEGVAHAADTLNDVHDFLNGKKTKTKITTKYDGAPSLVFGINPENNKFFVASKSAFNKTPKINYTPEDIERNHGHAPGLVEKLKVALKELKKVMPKEGGVYQGDIMYTKGDVKDDDGKLSFTPNTITYASDKNSANGRKIANANLGIVVHTKYKGKTLASMAAGFDVDHSKFKQDPDVHMINPEVNAANISGIEKKKYEKHLQDATNLYKGMHPEAFNALEGHDVTLKTYINSTVRDGTTPSAKGYEKFVTDRYQKEMDKLKSESGKAKKQAEMTKAIDHIVSNRKHFEDILRLHSHLQQAKDTLVNALSRTSEFETTIGGKKTKPEGFVAIRKGRPTKLVDRADFSRSNFLQGAFQKSGEEAPPAEDMPKKPVVFAFGRMNPPTSGHAALVGKVKELAKENKAHHEVVLSHSVDPEKNPLSAEKKLEHAKRFFPDTNISVASEKEPTLMHHAARLSKAGHDHLIVVAGSDRVPEYKALLDKYNGKNYNFKKIDVVSAGHRDPDAEGVEGMSASKMREHAINNKFSEFKKGIPSHVHPDHARQLFNDVRSGMDIRIDQDTSGISLARYAKRNDVIGVRARKEIERREQMKEMQKRAKRPAKKSIKEEMTTADIRGLGYVTGNPLVKDGFQTVWTTMNQADADTRDQIMNTTKKSVHDNMHADIQQKFAERRSEFIKTLVNSIKDKR